MTKKLGYPWRKYPKKSFAKQRANFLGHSNIRPPRTQAELEAAAETIAQQVCEALELADAARLKFNRRPGRSAPALEKGEFRLFPPVTWRNGIIPIWNMAASTAPPFIPSKDWQDVPDGIAVPPGGEYRINMGTGLSQARWDNPPPADQVKQMPSQGYVYREPQSRSEPTIPKRTRDYLAHGAPQGERNNELFEAACQLRDGGYARSRIDAIVIPRAESDGLSRAEIEATLDSVFRREARAPLSGNNGEEPWPPSPPAPTGVTLPPPLADGLKLLLETCFQEGEYVGISGTFLNASGEYKPGPGDYNLREAWLKRLTLDSIDKVYPGKDGLFIRINPTQGKADKDVTALRNGLVEWDRDARGQRIPKEIQYGALLNSKLPISVILDSGNKSIHGWVRVDAPDRYEYDRRLEVIREYFQKAGLPMDPQNKNPSRYSRCPGVDRNLYDEHQNPAGTGRQELLAINVGLSSWEEWEEQARDLKVETERVRAYYQPIQPLRPEPMAREAFIGKAGQFVQAVREAGTEA